MNFGWITPEGEIFGTKMYEHFSVFKNNKELTKFFDYPTWDLIVESAESEYTAEYDVFCESLEPDEHPCWHLFDVSVESLIQKMIYEAGFIRFGAYKNKFNEFVVETESIKEPPKQFIQNLLWEVNAMEAECFKRLDYRKKFYALKLEL